MSDVKPIQDTAPTPLEQGTAVAEMPQASKTGREDLKKPQVESAGTGFAARPRGRLTGSGWFGSGK